MCKAHKKIHSTPNIAPHAFHQEHIESPISMKPNRPEASLRCPLNQRLLALKLKLATQPYFAINFLFFYGRILYDT